MGERVQRVLSMALSMCLAASMFPFSVFAYATEPAQNVDTTSVIEPGGG